MENLEKVTVKKIIGPTPQGAAVLLGNDEKTFAVFIGPYEAMAMIRELKKEKMPRPLTHDLIQYILIGFGISIQKVIISELKHQTYFATLMLVRNEQDNNAEPTGERQEFRIDARPSDCFVLALKNKTDIFITREVFDKVEDIASQTEQLLAFGGILTGENSLEIEIPDGIGDEMDNFFNNDNASDTDADGDDL